MNNCRVPGNTSPTRLTPLRPGKSPFSSTTSGQRTQSANAAIGLLNRIAVAHPGQQEVGLCVRALLQSTCISLLCASIACATGVCTTSIQVSVTRLAGVDNGVVRHARVRDGEVLLARHERLHQLEVRLQQEAIRFLRLILIV